MTPRGQSCGKPLSEDNFFSECWRCSIGATHPLAPVVWFILFAVVFGVGWLLGPMAVVGLFGLLLVAAGIKWRVLVGGISRDRNPRFYWLALCAVAVAGVTLLLRAIAKV